MTRSRRIALAAAVAGSGYCAYRILGFISIMSSNELPWAGTKRFTRDHYQAVGQSYSQGFVIGFFFCFFLAVIATIVGNWYEANRDRKCAELKAAALAARVACQEG